MCARRLFGDTGCSGKLSRCVVGIDCMCITTRYGALTAALLMAVLLLTGCEEATRTPEQPNTGSRRHSASADGQTDRPETGARSDRGQPRYGSQMVCGGRYNRLRGVLRHRSDTGRQRAGRRTSEDFIRSRGPGVRHDLLLAGRLQGNEIGTITGDVWRFRTKATPPSKPAKATNPGPTHEAIGVSPHYKPQLGSNS